MAYLFVVWIPAEGTKTLEKVSQDNGNLHSARKASHQSDEETEYENTLSITLTDSTGAKHTKCVHLQKALKDLLDSINVRKYDWQTSEDGKFKQVLFVVEKEKTDFVLEHLYNIGIGTKDNTSISIFLSNYHSRGEGSEIIGKDTDEKGDQDKRAEFIKSVKARLTVAQVVEAVKFKSSLTFDYVLFLIIASIISVVGFIEDSSVILVVSILVAPIMGPLLAILFGIVIKNRALWQLGLKNLGISLVICVSIGFVFGSIASSINHDDVKWSGDTAWPTSSMRSRGVPRALWVGVLVSIPTGAGVALSILGGTSGPLVGVAVSASLLGPICNAGMLFADAIVSAISPPPTQGYSINSTFVFAASSGLNCTPLKGNDYEFYYTCNMGAEALILGLVSLTGTLLDILCMFIMGYIILKVKEVTPHTAQSDTFEMFWKKDIKVARKAYKNMPVSSTEQTDLARDIAKEEQEKRISVLPSIVMEIEDDRHYRRITGTLPIKPTDLEGMLDHSVYSSADEMARPRLRRIRSNPLGHKEVNSYLSKAKYTVADDTYEMDNNPV